MVSLQTLNRYCLLLRLKLNNRNFFNLIRICFYFQFVDMKKQSSSSAYAFVQYTDISSVVRAMRAMDAEYVGNNRVNLGYGKSLATTCVWVDGIAGKLSTRLRERKSRSVHLDRLRTVRYFFLSWNFSPFSSD